VLLEEPINPQMSTLNKSKLIVSGGAFVIYGPNSVPNWWWRLCQWLLLGWKWEKVDD
jgi:hypothetical protein